MSKLLTIKRWTQKDANRHTISWAMGAEFKSSEYKLK